MKTAEKKPAAAPAKKAVARNHPDKIAIGLARPDPNQPRKEFDQAKLRELADSIKEQGIVHKLLVVYVPGLRVDEPDMIEKQWKAVEEGSGRVVSTGSEKAVRDFVKGKEDGFYMIVDGERRWRAAQLLGLKEVPIDCREMTAEQIRNIQIISATQRENLSALEEAAAFHREIELRKQSDKTFSPEKLATELGMKRTTIYNRLGLLRLHEPVRQALVAGEIDVTVAGELSKVPDPQLQLEALKEALPNQHRGPMPFRRVKEMIERDYVRTLNPKLFHLDKVYEGGIEGRKGASPLKDAGTCEKCPRRSGNMVGVEIKSPNVCTDPPCFEAKKRAAAIRRLEQAKSEGKRVMDHAQYRTEQNRLVQADDTCYDDTSYRKWGQLMGRHAPAPILAENDGDVIEVWPKDEAREAAKKNGIKFEKSTHNAGDQAYRNAQKKKKKLTAVAQYAAGSVLDRLVLKKGVDERLWRLLALELNKWASIDVQSFVAKRRGLARVVPEVRPALDKWFREKRTTADYQALIVETLLCANAVTHWNPIIGKAFKELCALAKVDLAKCEKEVAAGKSPIVRPQQLELGNASSTKKKGKK